MSASNLKKIGLVILVLVVFFIYLKVNDYRTKHFKVDAKTFHVQPTKQALLNQEFKVMPLLVPANKYHIMINENVNIPLVDMRRNLHIEKSWLYGNSLYLMYSVDLRDTDHSLSDVPKLSFSKIRLHFSNGKTVTLTLTNHNQQLPFNTPATRFTYGHRVYDEMFNYLPLTQKLSVSTNTDYLNAIKKINSATLIDPTMTVNKKKTLLDPITFPISLNQENYYVDSQPINKTITVKGAKIQFESVKTYFDHKELNYKTIQNPNHITSLEYQVTGLVLGNSHTQTTTFTSELDLSRTTTYAGVSSNHQVKLTPTRVMFKQNKNLTIKISPADFKYAINNNANKDKKVAHVLNGQLSFGIDQGMNPNAFYLGFTSDLKNGPQLSDQSNILTQKQVNAMPAQVKDTATIASVTALDGTPINVVLENAFYAISDPNNATQKIYFNVSNLDTLKNGFIIHLDGLMYQEPIKSPPITFSLK